MDNPLPGVPHVESPFFERLFAEADEETRRVARDLATRGYAVIDFPEPAFDELARRIRGDLHPRYDWAEWWRQPQAGLRIQDAWRFNEDVRRLAVNAEVLALLGRVYGREAFAFQTLNFPVGTQQHFHTDSVHFSSLPERFMCGVWVALEDVGPEQGPLIYYPGTQRWPIYGNEHVAHTATLAEKNGQHVYEPLWRALVADAGIAPERFQARAGQALIWAANLLHGGDIHRDISRTRWSQVTHYYFADCAWWTPLASDPPLGATFYREPIDIATGRPRRNRYNGVELPPEVVRGAHPGEVRRRIEAREPDAAAFDAAAYLAANPDVAAAGDDAWAHWQAYGREEGRLLRP